MGADAYTRRQSPAHGHLRGPGGAQSGTPAELLKTRTRDHLASAKRKPKELGLHWAINRFGPDAFQVRILEKETLPRLAAMAWADEREKALIAERGGVMRDREPKEKIKQTLNLTRGGQGDPRRRWDAIQLSSLQRWQALKQHLIRYYACEGNLRVPGPYVTDDKYPLGQTQSMRYNGCPSMATPTASRGCRPWGGSTGSGMPCGRT